MYHGRSGKSTPACQNIVKMRAGQSGHAKGIRPCDCHDCGYDTVTGEVQDRQREGRCEQQHENVGVVETVAAGESLAGQVVRVRKHGWLLGCREMRGKIPAKRRKLQIWGAASPPRPGARLRQSASWSGGRRRTRHQSRSHRGAP